MRFGILLSGIFQITPKKGGHKQTNKSEEVGGLSLEQQGKLVLSEDYVICFKK